MSFLSIIGWASDAIDGQMMALMAWITAGFGTLYGDIAGVNSFLGGLGDAVHSTFATLWSWLTNLWQWIQDHLIGKLADLINKIKDKLQRIFGPLLCHLKQAIATYTKLWNTYVKPLYDFLQRIRRVLVIFRLLGFKWAQKLDARIVALETALTNSFLGVLANLNRLADWINFIIDPFGLLQANVLLGSIARAVGDIVNIFGIALQGASPKPTTPFYSTPANYYSSDAVRARIAARIAYGQLPADDEVLASLRRSANELGYTY